MGSRLHIREVPEGLPEPSVAVPKAPPLRPVVVQCEEQFQRSWVIDIVEPLQRCANVCVVEVDAEEPLRLSCALVAICDRVEEGGRVSGPQLRSECGIELLQGELADRLQHPELIVGIGTLTEQVLFDERREDVEEGDVARAVGVAHPPVAPRVQRTRRWRSSQRRSSQVPRPGCGSGAGVG